MEALQIIWFILVFVLLTGYAILDGFDLGVGCWHLFTKKKEDRDHLIKAIGPFWDGNEVWLLTGAGALFAAFPPVYATTFSGFYLAMMLVIFSLIFRATAIEFRGIIECDVWRKRWDLAFAVGSTLPALLFGVAVGNVVRGIPMNEIGDYTGTFLELLNPYALVIGLTSLTMFAVQGAAFINLKTSGDLQKKSVSWLNKAWMVYTPLHIIATVWTLFAYDHASIVLSSALAVISIVVVFGIKIAHNKCKELGVFMITSLSILLNMAYVACSIFPYFVPEFGTRLEGLSIYNSSSSQLTLTVMLIMTVIGLPFVLGYTAYIYRTFAGKVDR
ncbi:MAG: cytochrome d ubiquinol oxidase subunit II [Bacteriovoracaceae bacterium]|nr:cytochrome d ubiquinol oxidase subunit II [Bacteriovoracaceae bacterium]